MIAITVVLTTVLGTFVLEIGAEQERIPSASIQFEYDRPNDAVTATHEGGDTLTGRVVVTKNGGSATEWPAPIEAGDRFSVGTGGDLPTTVTAGDEITVVWRSSGGDETKVVGKFVVP
jgi:FlaG/FlaF family flagellin (archaellin)